MEKGAQASDSDSDETVIEGSIQSPDATTAAARLSAALHLHFLKYLRLDPIEEDSELLKKIIYEDKGLALYGGRNRSLHWAGAEVLAPRIGVGLCSWQPVPHFPPHAMTGKLPPTVEPMAEEDRHGGVGHPFMRHLRREVKAFLRKFTFYVISIKEILSISDQELLPCHVMERYWKFYVESTSAAMQEQECSGSQQTQKGLSLEQEQYSQYWKSNPGSNIILCGQRGQIPGTVPYPPPSRCGSPTTPTVSVLQSEHTHRTPNKDLESQTLPG
ncbi:hypothetical protein A6R68_16563 [Neotoma lepida]|uniref:Uncharacterized protein n=1 Tax=Neotoma lepida TaxID=56216 RepID=A0A1A6HFF4_NEOLE|nr:hypothetical protein A6R68_16563 [Neotoma lepida]